MKIVSLLSVFASLLAAVVLPVQLEITGAMLFIAGLVVLMAQDYSARRSLRFETASPAAAQFTARFFFHRPAVTPRATFRAPALNAEPHRLAA